MQGKVTTTMPKTDDSPVAAVDAFLAAFSRLDLDGMMAFFAADATMFAPIEYAREWLPAPAAIREQFAAVIAGVRAQGATTIPLHPQDTHVRVFGEVALVTFHLRGDHLSRRTLMLRRGGERWEIVHLHASNAPLPLQAEGGARPAPGAPATA
jgi:ketosteroid isomerase-like protein